MCTSTAELQAEGEQADAHRSLVSCVSHERHRHVATSPTSLPHGGFNLHIFEFDDDGLPWNPRQQAESFDIIKRQLDHGPAVVVAFVHGWKNDASACNGNLSCYRDVLTILFEGRNALRRSRRHAAAGRGGLHRLAGRQHPHQGSQGADVLGP